MDLFAENRSVSQLSEETLKRYLKPLLSDKSVLKIGHNIKTSMHFIAKFLGTGTDFFPLEDIAVLSYDLDSSEHGHSLDELCGLFLDVTPQKFEELIGTGKNKIPFDKVGIEQAMDYMAARADYALRLYHILKPRLIAEQKVGVYENFDRPLLKTLYAMEERGIMVNAKALQELSIYFDSEIRQIEARIFELAGEEFNVGSPKQIGEILFDRQGLKGKKTPTGAWQTGADVLEQLAEQGIELAQRILDWREFSKLKSTYSDALFALLDKDNRIHTTYNQFVANTGRLASNNPNLQNIPIRSEQGKKIRACFIAKPGHKIISSDYSQVELRLLASVADVKNLKKLLPTASTFIRPRLLMCSAFRLIRSMQTCVVTLRQSTLELFTAYPNMDWPKISASALMKRKLISTPILHKCLKSNNIWRKQSLLPANTVMF